MVRLEHGTGDCVGHWRLLGGSDDRSIRCDRCGAAYNATAEYRLAAIDENYAGIYLQRLASEGATHLGGEERRER